MKLSPSQQKALAALSDVEWKSAYDIQVSISTLDSLVKKKLATRKIEQGHMFSPRTAIMFRRRMM